jgi:hypothetical protein
VARSQWTAVAFALGLGGCVQQAVLENDVRNAQWKARTLATASDSSIAHAALSAQLVELEALYQRDRSDPRVGALLVRGYRLMSRGFIEIRRLQAVAAGDDARAAQEVQLAADAEARALYYGSSASGGATDANLELDQPLAEPAAACARHDRVAYENQLNALLLAPERGPEQRLAHALVRQLASAWLMPRVAARCGF